MPTVAGLVLYPIKSCAGIPVQEATVTPFGLAVEAVHDREWMLVREDGSCITQREYPRMALIKPQFKDGAVEVRAPGVAALSLPEANGAATRTVQIWDDAVQAWDCGDAAAAWFSEAIDAPCRLVRFPPLARRPTSTKWTGGAEAHTLFADGYPILIVGTASLEDLNGKLRAAGRDPLPMDRFRPNVVVDGIEAFEEDYTATFTSGSLVLRPVKPCPRCPIPSVDQQTGSFGPDPLDILRTYRTKPQLDDGICFGMNAIVAAGAGARLRVGQPLDAELAF
ncbi:MAG: MOSC domain-containing protein [Telluria sp.]